MDDGANAVTFLIRDAQLIHQLPVSGSHPDPIDERRDALAADLLHLAHPRTVDLLSISLLQRLTDGMRRSAFGQRRIFDKLMLVDDAVMDGIDREYAFGQRACLIKDDGLGLRQRFQIVGALDQDPRIARAADTGEEAQGDADDERARTADDQEGQRAVDP